MIEDFDNFVQLLTSKRPSIDRYTKAAADVEKLEAHVAGLNRTIKSLNSESQNLRERIDSERNGILRKHTDEVNAKQHEFHRLTKLIAEAEAELKLLQTQVHETYNKHEALKAKVGKLEQSMA